MAEPASGAAPAIASDASPAATVAGEAHERCGGFVLGRMQLALPMHALREVVPLGPLLGLPGAVPQVIGGLDLRGVSLPVLDLHRVFGTRPAETATPTVIVMLHQGRLLGLLADGVTGIFNVAPGSRMAMSTAHSAGPSAGPPADSPGVSGASRASDATGDHAPIAAHLVAASVRRADGQTLVSLLSPEALSRLPGVPMVQDHEPGRQRHDSTACGTAPALQTRHLMLLRCQRVALAIDAMAVHATLQVHRVERSVLAMGACRGVVRHADHDVPAVDLMALCGLGDGTEAGPRQAFVLKLPDGLVALLVDRVVDVVRCDAVQAVPLPPFALPRPELFMGALATTDLQGDVALLLRELGTQLLMLDGAALAAEDTLQSLAQAARHREAGSGTTVARHAGAAPPPGARTRQPMITFELFGEAAVPIGQVAEILPYRPESAIFDGPGPTLGLVIDRGRSIPVLCLRRLAGGESLPAGPTTSVLVVQVEGHWVGFAVPQLRAIETADWTPALPEHAVGAQDLLSQALQSHQLAQVGQGAQQRMLRVLNLEGVARALLPAVTSTEPHPAHGMQEAQTMMGEDDAAQAPASAMLAA